MESRKGIHSARRLRSSSTQAELALWVRLRARRLQQLKFRRQFPVSGYVVDFVCLEAKLVVEVDSGQHADLEAEDAHRTAVLGASGFHVLRFWNDDVLKRLDSVLEEILRTANARISPLPPGGRGRRA
jgi:very-short-patch-repair endonuclease